MTWHVQVLSLFPEMFPGPLGHSLAGRALENDLWSLQTHQIRDYALNKHRNVDDTPAGGGPGMVMRADVLGLAIDEVLRKRPETVSKGQNNWPENWPVVYLSPRGKRFDQAMAKKFASCDGITLICGRFEGIDERILEAREIQEVSLGDFVLSGGEVAALTLMDAVVRLLPGVIGEPETLEEESFETGLLEYPHYTRPQVWEDREIPEVLLSGHHGKIREWRREQAEKLTQERRPDLWNRFVNKKGLDKPD